jgi:hypothetical protein
MEASLARNSRPAEGRQAKCVARNCACRLPVSDRFVLWALRQWRCEVDGWGQGQSLPPGGSPLQRGFQSAGARRALPDFAMAMDAMLFGMRQPMEIRPPNCPALSRDEAVLIALCGLAQGNHDGPLKASLDRMMEPAAAQGAAVRLKLFAVALGDAGMRFSTMPANDAAGRLN